MKVRYTPRAFADREEIFAYLDERNPRAAREVKAFIKRRIASLAQNPGRGPRLRTSASMPIGSVAIPTSSITERLGMKFGLSTSGKQRGSHGAGNDRLG